MPRYFFDVHDGQSYTDETGVDLPDPEAARVHAMRVASEFVGNPGMLRSDGGAIVVEVHGPARTKVLTVRLAFDVAAH